MDGKNLYVLIYHYLLTRIHYGFYPKSESLPSIHKLSSLFGVSTMAVRGALKLLRQNGYLSEEKDGRSVVLYDPENPKQEFPAHILVQGDMLEDVHQSFDLIFQSVYFSGLCLCDKQQLDELHQILDRSMTAWNEPTVDFSTHIVKYLRNSLLLDLYYDVLLFCYPTYLAHVLSDQERWNKGSKLLHKKLNEILRLKESGNHAVLWDVIKRTGPSFKPKLVSGNETELASAYQWGKPQICLSTASELVSRIYHGQYPVDTFLPSARILADELSAAVITTRRSIVLLNDLGVAESVNGKGTRVISPARGLQKVKWDDPAIRKNIILYLESLYILAITCRLLAVTLFPLVTPEERIRTIDEINLSNQEKYVGLANTICLRTILSASDLPPLKAVYDKLFSLLIWGQPLSYLEPYLQLDYYRETLVASLKTNDATLFGFTLEQAYAVTFLSSRKKAISVGIDEAERLFLPFPEPEI